MVESQEDPFDVIGIEPTFDLDVDALKRTLRRRIAAHHPDRVSDPIARDEAVRVVARLNEARSVLENDERRANLALTRLGGPSASDDRSLPPNFLMEILEVRGDMESALASGDPAERDRVQGWAESERSRLRELVRSLFEEFQRGEDRASDIRLQLNVWRYIERMIEQLNPEGIDPFAGPGGS
jgi:molecular chaperone HscB